ncbi:Type IV pilus assembly PilZ domain protein [Candidatus Magnetomorum sp. HK-1]|nr:Type IV pilus assembly PilZ domain protein [Candidatus Magnetomorum sp. HK-1]
MKEKTNSDKRIDSRIPIKTKVEFFVDADIIDAESVNISSSGIRFDTQIPIPIQMRLEKDGILYENRAHLVWAQSKDDAGMTYGFQFVYDEDPKAKNISF